MKMDIKHLLHMRDYLIMLYEAARTAEADGVSEEARADIEAELQEARERYDELCTIKPHNSSLNFLIVENLDLNTKRAVYFEDKEKLYCAYSRYMAFSDMVDYERVCEAYANGQRVTYAGWEPNMVFNFLDANGNVVWSEDHPDWEH